MSATIPESYWRVIAPLIESAKEILESGEALAPIAFVGSFTPEVCVPVLLKASSTEAKEKSALDIKVTAAHLDADFIFLIIEAWSLRKDKVAQSKAILEKYGSISASPYAVDIVSMSLETRNGIWMAEVPVEPKGVSKRKRTLGTLEFRHFDEAKGRFVNLLPPKDGTTSLH